DWKMPGMDGMEAARQIRENVRLARLPTIMMVSAYAREEAMTEAETVGISAFLVKPVDAGMLLDTIMNLCGGEGRLPAAVPVASDQPPKVAPELRGARVLLAEDN